MVLGSALRSHAFRSYPDDRRDNARTRRSGEDGQGLPRDIDLNGSRPTPNTSITEAVTALRADSGDVKPLSSAGHPQVSSPRRRGSSNPGNVAEYWVPAFFAGRQA